MQLACLFSSFKCSPFKERLAVANWPLDMVVSMLKGEPGKNK
jgi:hypothetical protein